MTEAEWLACEDPHRMLTFLCRTDQVRKCLLFSCACCRRIWDQITDARSRSVVDVAERWADAAVTGEEWHAAIEDARAAVRLQGASSAAASAAIHTAMSGSPDAAQAAITRIARCAVASPRHSTTVAKAKRMVIERRRQCELLRDIFGNPFRPVAVVAAWLTWNDSIITKLARAIYDERAFDRLPILADALEEAGCTNTDILNHCRQLGEHVRGCWVVDLILGKS